jgi:Na+/H+-dicarboxylate symporter
MAALVVLAIFLSLSSLFGGEMAAQVIPSLLSKTLEYGFAIIGWVMLWRPIEILVFEPIALKDNIVALQKSSELRVLIHKSS